MLSKCMILDFRRRFFQQLLRHLFVLQTFLWLLWLRPLSERLSKELDSTPRSTFPLRRFSQAVQLHRRAADVDGMSAIVLTRRVFPRLSCFHFCFRVVTSSEDFQTRVCQARLCVVVVVLWHAR